MIDLKTATSKRTKSTNVPGGKLEKRFAAYATAAGAAGVAMLALAQPAKADIIYTPAHITFSDGGVSLDFNHDGGADFRLAVFFPSTYPFTFGLFLDRGVNGQRASVVGTYFHPASALRLGARIGPGDNFTTVAKEPAGLAFGTGYFTQGFGNWVDVQNRYLGLRFSVDGQAYYGWAGLSVRRFDYNQFSISVVLQGYAFEDTPNTPILAGAKPVPNLPADSTPEPATLGLLALGSLGLGFWRRKKTATNCR